MNFARFRLAALAPGGQRVSGEGEAAARLTLPGRQRLRGVAREVGYKEGGHIKFLTKLLVTFHK